MDVKDVRNIIKDFYGDYYDYLTEVKDNGDFFFNTSYSEKTFCTLKGRVVNNGIVQLCQEFTKEANNNSNYEFIISAVNINDYNLILNFNCKDELYNSLVKIANIVYNNMEQIIESLSNGISANEIIEEYNLPEWTEFEIDNQNIKKIMIITS